MGSVVDAMFNEVPAYTWNGAKSNANVGTDSLADCLEYFSKAGTYADRPQDEVNISMDKIFSDNKDVAIKLLMGLRLITRKFEDFDEVQTGFGRRDEFYKALVWLEANRPEDFSKVIKLVPVFGSWKDLFQPPLSQFTDHILPLVKENIEDDLLKKFLPTIRAKARSERDAARIKLGRQICEYLGITEKDYRKLKSSGNAHIFQKQMSSGDWSNINLNGIPGKAMLNLVGRTGKDGKSALERHGQVERLKAWVQAQPTVKFTGYPYELAIAAQKANMIQGLVYDKQFEKMVEGFTGHKLGNVLCALDTSGSMGIQVVPGVRAVDICLSLGAVFSSLNLGYFKDVVAMFDEKSKLQKLDGGFTTRIKTLHSLPVAWGSTNFQSIIDLLVNTRRANPDIPLEDFPDTILVISDMQFNPVGGNTETNYKAAMRRLADVGLGETRIIWWFVNGAGTDFPSKMDDKGVYMIGGFDPVNLKALMGLNAQKDSVEREDLQQTPVDGMLNFLSQPIFSLLDTAANAG